MARLFEEPRATQVTNPRRRAGVGIGALVAMLGSLARPCAAHDFWIEPSTFEPGAGADVELELLVGERFVGDPVPRDPSRIVSFAAHGKTLSVAVEGLPGDQPAGTVRLPTAGLWVVAYRSSPAFLELDAPKFEEYLKLEGLEAALAERQRRGESAAKSRELFSRCAKALLRVAGQSAGTGQDRALGLPLELVAERDPTALPSSAKLPVRLLYQGRPLAGALIVAMPRSDPSKTQSVRSDREGRAQFALADAGAWLIKAVHIVRLENNPRAEWESLWASLSFALAGPVAATR